MKAYLKDATAAADFDEAEALYVRMRTADPKNRGLPLAAAQLLVMAATFDLARGDGVALARRLDAVTALLDQLVETDLSANESRGLAQTRIGLSNLLAAANRPDAARAAMAAGVAIARRLSDAAPDRADLKNELVVALSARGQLPLQPR